MSTFTCMLIILGNTLVLCIEFQHLNSKSINQIRLWWIYIWTALNLLIIPLYLQVARRHLHRPVLVYRLKQLVIIDGIPINEEERGKAELYFMDQQVKVSTQRACTELIHPMGLYWTYPPNGPILNLSTQSAFIELIHSMGLCTELVHLTNRPLLNLSTQLAYTELLHPTGLCLSYPPNRSLLNLSTQWACTELVHPMGLYWTYPPNGPIRNSSTRGMKGWRGAFTTYYVYYISL